MARIRESKRCFEARENMALSRVSYDKPYGLFWIVSVLSGAPLTVKQARRLARWLTDRCDEIERKRDE